MSWTDVLPAIAAVGLGAAGWFAANFLGEPLLRFARLRRDIHESLIFTANISSIIRVEIQNAGYDELRRHGARLEALWTTAPQLVRRSWVFRRYDLTGAATALIGLSNSLSDATGSRAIFRTRIQKGLRLPRDYTDQELKDIRDEQSRRARLA
jgi:hypothetical protein